MSGRSDFHLPFPKWTLPTLAGLVPIETLEALEGESRELENSALEYEKDVRYGAAFLFRMTAPERGTVLLWFCNHRWNFEDILMRHGGPASPLTRSYVESWVRSLPST